MIIEKAFTESYDKRISLGLGFFDCVHSGHRRIIDACLSAANYLHCQSAIMTFTNNIYSTLGTNDKLVYTYDERKSILQDLGLNIVIGAEFDSSFMQLTSDEFLSKLFGSFDIRHLICGYDYTYGCDKKSAKDLSLFCQKKNIPLSIIPRYDINGERVSTTQIKYLLGNSQIDTVNALLSRDFTITGEVVKGRGVGTKIGFPTANILVSDDKLLPLGVFAAKTSIDGTEYTAVVNIGAKPTFSISQISVEAHIVNYNGDLYGRFLTFTLLKYMRKISLFETVGELTAQLRKDCINANKIRAQR